MTLFQLISPTTIESIAWALFCFLWQGALMALGLKAALALLPRQRADLRYTAACAALLLMTAMPLATAWTALGSAPQASIVSTRAVQPVLTAAQPLPTAESTSGSLGSWWAGPPPSFPAVTLETQTGQTWRGEISRRFTYSLRAQLGPWLPQLFALWLSGVALLTLAHLGGWLRVRALKHQGTSPAGPPWKKSLARIAGHLGLEQPIDLLASTQVRVPTVIGWLRPVVLVPVSAFTGLDPRQLESLLAHELAHIKRHDAWVNLLQVGVETLLFYHPAVWWVSGQVRILREHCCDDLAVAVCGDRRTYAHALANLEDLRAPSALPALALAADGGSLLGRIRRLAGVETRRQRPAQALASGAMATVFLALVTLQVVSGPTSYAQPEAPRAPETPTAPVPTVPIPVAPTPDAPTPPARAPRAFTPPTPPSAPAVSRVPTPPTLHRSWHSRAPELPGHWMAERSDDSMWIQMRSRHADGGSGTSGFSIESSELVEQADGFELRREAGTFSFRGEFTGGSGSGTFDFSPDPNYVEEMASLGYRDLPTEDMFKLALFDIGPGLVREFASLGYDDVPLERLVEVTIHDVDPETIRALAAAGYENLPFERLVEFSIHGITPQFLQEMAERGHTNLSAEELVELRIHGGRRRQIY